MCTGQPAKDSASKTCRQLSLPLPKHPVAAITQHTKRHVLNPDAAEFVLRQPSSQVEQVQQKDVQMTSVDFNTQLINEQAKGPLSGQPSDNTAEPLLETLASLPTVQAKASQDQQQQADIAKRLLTKISPLKADVAPLTPEARYIGTKNPAPQLSQGLVSTSSKKHAPSKVLSDVEWVTAGELHLHSCIQPL